MSAQDVIEFTTDIVDIADIEDTHTAITGLGLALALIIFDRNETHNDSLMAMQKITEKMVDLIDELHASPDTNEPKAQILLLLRILKNCPPPRA